MHQPSGDSMPKVHVFLGGKQANVWRTNVRSNTGIVRILARLPHIEDLLKAIGTPNKKALPPKRSPTPCGKTDRGACNSWRQPAKVPKELNAISGTAQSADFGNMTIASFVTSAPTPIFQNSTASKPQRPQRESAPCRGLGRRASCRETNSQEMQVYTAFLAILVIIMLPLQLRGGKPSEIQGR